MRSGILLRLALAALLLSGCSEKLLVPGFPFAGEWSGRIADPTIILSNNHSLKFSLLGEVSEEGSLRFDTERVLSYGTGNVTIRVIMELEVMPDGAVAGTGSYTMGAPFSLVRHGEVLGQFNTEADYASGALVLVATPSMPLTLMSWTLRRVQ